MEKLISFLKIGGSMLFSYLIVSMISPLLFMEKNSPLIRDNVPQYIASQVQERILNQTTDLQRKTEKSIHDRYMALEDVAMQNIAVGVKAREKDGVSEVYYDSNNIQWKKYTYTLKSGKVITIKVPASEEPPPGAIAQ